MRPLLKILLFLMLMITWIFQGQEIYKSTAVATEFFSSAPIEDIAAHANDGVSLWNTKTGEINFRVNIRSFDFEKSKMQEHFNENFMESHKYPYATFKGEVQDQPDFSEEGEYQVKVVGVLDIHGVKRNREIPAVIKVKGDGVELQSKFKVAVADHDIEIPKILWENIAEVISVEVHANYTQLDL